MKRLLLSVGFCFLFTFKSIYSMGVAVGFDNVVSDLVNTSLKLKSDCLHHYFSEVAYKQCLVIAVSNCLKSKNLNLGMSDMVSIQNLIEDILKFCRRDVISENVLVLTLIYFEKILNKPAWLEKIPKKDLSQKIKSIFVGCFILACKYLEDYSMHVKDFIYIYLIRSHPEFICGAAEIKQYLHVAENEAFRDLEFNLFVTADFFSTFVFSLLSFTFDSRQQTLIQSLDKEKFIQLYTNEILLVLSSYGYEGADFPVISGFITNFCNSYPEKYSSFDIIIKAFARFEKATGKIISIKKDFGVDDIQMTLFGCFMLLDHTVDVDWDLLFKSVIPEHLRVVSLRTLHDKIMYFGACACFNDSALGDFIRRLTLVG